MPFTVGQYLTANDLKSQEDAHTLGYGVVNGLKVVPTDPVSMDVQVETGKAYVADTLVEKGAVTDLTVTAADPTNPRKDIVVCDSAGTLSIVAGTPEAALPSGNVGVYTLNPEPPSIPADSIILAEIWVPAGATEISGSEIYDKRVFTVGRLDMTRMPDMALDKVMVGQGAGVSPVEEDKPAGDMAKAVYDPNADGKIALAQLVDAVCSETEADGKITTHADNPSAHHTAYTHPTTGTCPQNPNIPNLTTLINTSWATQNQTEKTTVTRFGEITGKGAVHYSHKGGGSSYTTTRVIVDGTIINSLGGDVTAETVVIFFSSLKIETYNDSTIGKDISGGSVNGNYGS